MSHSLQPQYLAYSALIFSLILNHKDKKINYMPNDVHEFTTLVNVKWNND